MRKLIAQQFVTANNIAAEADGGMSFIGDYGTPSYETPGRAFVAEAIRFMDEVDTMVLGANTYRMFTSSWPEVSAQDEIGNKLNRLHKYVASRKLTEAPWGDFEAGTITANPVATVKQLKQSGGKDIVLWGSLQLMHDLAAEGLVDEYYLRVCAATRAQGTPLFTGDENLHLVEAKAYDGDIVTLRYAVQTKA